MEVVMCDLWGGVRKDIIVSALLSDGSVILWELVTMLGGCSSNNLEKTMWHRTEPSYRQPHLLVSCVSDPSFEWLLQ